MLLSGCEATGDAGGTKTFRDDAIPFTFELPTEFAKEDVDNGNSRGDVVAAAGVTKVDVVAVRRGTALGARESTILGKRVTSELRAVEGHDGWVLECQYTPDFADKVRSACAAALESVKPK
ncbi:MAG: hypothetical protein ACJ762_21655 [Solirubrobacteraceae bacterium]